MDNQALLELTQSLVTRQSQALSLADGFYATACPQVRLFYRACKPTHYPMLYTPGLVLLFSGQKTAQLGTTKYVYHRDQGLLLSGSYPVLCHEVASATAPLIGMHIQLERGQVAQLLSQIEQLKPKINLLKASSPAPQTPSMLTFPITADIRLALYQVLQVLGDEIAAQLFAETLIQALIYVLIQQAAVHRFLQAWVAQDGRYAQFLKATDYIQSQLATALTVPRIASQAGLSVASLNRAFKHYTAHTPMQYVKKLRLSKAHSQLTQTACTIQTAAYEVGYESVSQFSREYSRLFGAPPLRHRNEQNSRRTN
ncbi:MAG: AraC family transcriptional regulator [Thiothrix sp.]|nr:MAG: AraC family transcriptional regulator [Thiothrix sp.]